jgi:hypothetical protein
MIWQAWAVLVLVGAGTSYLAFVAKRAAVYTSLTTFGVSAVTGFGALGLETKWTTSGEPGVAILLWTNAVVAAIVFVAAISGQYGDPDDEDTPTGGMGETRGGGYFDGLAKRMR